MATPTLPLDVVPLPINNKQMEALDLKTGPGRHETIAYKIIAKADALAECISLGFYSAFHPLREQIKVSRRKDPL